MSVGTLQHFRSVSGPIPTSKEKVVHGLSCLSTCTLICLGGIGSNTNIIFKNLYTLAPGPLALIINILAASHSFALCATPPNPPPPPKERNIKDRLSFFVGSFAAIVRSIVLFVLLYHAVIVFMSEYVPTRISHICPRVENRNADLFT
jgi:hypothetical protein